MFPVLSIGIFQKIIFIINIKSLDDRHKLCKKTMLETALNMSFKHIYNVLWNNMIVTISIYFCDYYDIKADDDVDTFTDDQNKQWKQYS